MRLLKLPFASRNIRISSAFSKDGQPNELVRRFLYLYIFLIWIVFLGFGTKAIIIAMENKILDSSYP